MKIAAVVLGIPLLMFASVASTSFAVVDVRESGPDGVRIVVPVPLFLAQVAVGFAPADKTRVELPPEFEEYAPAALEILAALEDAPDGVLVEVQERDEHVLIHKVGDELKIEVDSDSEQVAVNVPFDAVHEILAEAQDGELTAGDVIASLRGLSRTDLVEVRNGDEHVKVWIW